MTLLNTLKDLGHRDAVKEKQRFFSCGGNIFILSNILSAQTTQCHILYITTGLTFCRPWMTRIAWLHLVQSICSHGYLTVSDRWSRWHTDLWAPIHNTSSVGARSCRSPLLFLRHVKLRRSRRTSCEKEKDCLKNILCAAKPIHYQPQGRNHQLSSLCVHVPEIHSTHDQSWNRSNAVAGHRDVKLFILLCQVDGLRLNGVVVKGRGLKRRAKELTFSFGLLIGETGNNELTFISAGGRKGDAISTSYKAAELATSSIWGDFPAVTVENKAGYFSQEVGSSASVLCGDISSCFRGDQNRYFKTKLNVFLTLTEWFVLRLNLNVWMRKKQKILPKETFSLKWSVVAYAEPNLRKSPEGTKRQVFELTTSKMKV